MREHMEEYNRYVVYDEYLDRVCDGYRYFCCNDGKPYYDGPDYSEALAVYRKMVKDTDGVKNATILLGTLDPADQYYNVYWEVLLTNEIYEIKEDEEDDDDENDDDEK